MKWVSFCYLANIYWSNSKLIQLVGGLMVRIVASQFKGREFKSRYGQDFFFENSDFAPLAARERPCKWHQPWHKPSTHPSLDKDSIEKKYGICLQLYTTVHVSFFFFKLAYIHMNYRHRFFNSISTSMHLLLWMNVILGVICMGFAELWRTWSKWNIQNENVFLHRESNQWLLAFRSGALDESATHWPMFTNV